MEKMFFAPVDRLVKITTMGNKECRGFFKGFIQLGGIPAIWLEDEYDQELHTSVIPIIQVLEFSFIKPKTHNEQIIL
jgi:hypothetical protein